MQFRDRPVDMSCKWRSGVRQAKLKHVAIGSRGRIDGLDGENSVGMGLDSSSSLASCFIQTRPMLFTVDRGQRALPRWPAGYESSGDTAYISY